jgi:copper resistance protein C
MRRLSLITLAVSALFVSALPAAAHPRLVSASPAADASVASPTQIVLTFSESLVAPLSGIELTMTAMPGMTDHPRTPIRGVTTKVEGSKLTAKLSRPLSAGTYELNWHVVAGDQHRIENTYTFTVR